MSPRRIHETVAANIRAAADASGLSLTSVAEATDVPLQKLVAHPSAGDFDLLEVSRIGGLFRVPASTFFQEARA